jgi:hypothetical protein
MATPSKAKPSSQPGLVDLFKEEQELQARLDEIKQRKADLAREQAQEIRNDVLKRLTDIAGLIAPLMEQEAWSWRSMVEFEGVLSELELMPKEAKPIVANNELHELVVEYVKSKPHGVGIDDIANNIRDTSGQPRWKVPSLRPQLPLMVKEGKLKVRPDGRRNIYFVEAK